MDGISISVDVIVGANRMKTDRNMFPIEICVCICTHHEKWAYVKAGIFVVMGVDAKKMTISPTEFGPKFPATLRLLSRQSSLSKRF